VTTTQQPLQVYVRHNLDVSSRYSW
jgi:hypothetical protein